LITIDGVGSDRTYQVIRVVRAAVLYFAVVFAAGFILGTLRFILVIPLVGTRAAELIEMPVMLAICYFTASWLIARLAIPFTIVGRLGIGLIALAMLLGAELGIVLWLQHLSLSDYLRDRDPVSGTAYVVSLLLFAAFPLIVHRAANADVLRN